MLHSENIPEIPFQITNTEMGDLFANFALNWSTLSPATYLLYGVLLGFFFLGLMKKIND